MNPADACICPVCDAGVKARPGWTLDHTFVRHVLNFHLEDFVATHGIEANRPLREGRLIDDVREGLMGRWQEEST